MYAVRQACPLCGAGILPTTAEHPGILTIRAAVCGFTENRSAGQSISSNTTISEDLHIIMEKQWQRLLRDRCAGGRRNGSFRSLCTGNDTEREAITRLFCWQKELGERLGIPVDPLVWSAGKVLRLRKCWANRKGSEICRMLLQCLRTSCRFQQSLLIDDIYTTGNTMDAAAAVLKKGGVQKVYFLTISIGQG